ncbi:hypothetical protein OE88DRAFT_976143 [Heliocybe sulcata]|uniref:TEA domain-containing protein n=1 Tax=Heliocybe sulcata TaxID=5364 RepID=A0A5C3NC93_9AGAM|nr:hypothetical protein OE88DRAFT_976143 [Heliocybe sulcata]
MPAIASPSSSPSSSMSCTQKTLTPQRKHRKMLKDGSSEVWPESVEEIFVQGLREYWQSPWATFSRGRSRWRNQFLVDFLNKRGIERSKKQVASHIQVLRNMWKGEHEYSLVAAGDELFDGMNSLTSESHQGDSLAINVKEEYGGQAPLLFPSSPGSSDSDTTYDSPTGSEFYSAAIASPTGTNYVDSSATASGVQVDPSYAFDPITKVKQEQMDAPPSGLMQSYSDHPATPWPTNSPSQPMHPASFVSSPSSEILAAPSHKFPAPTSPEPLLTRAVHTSIPMLRIPGADAAPPMCNRVTGVYVWAQSMGRFAVPVDDRTCALPNDPLNSSPVHIRLRVHLPILRGGLCDAPWSEGFQSVVQLNSQWTSGHCTTRVQGAPAGIEETSSLRPYQSMNPSCLLPDSWLTKSQWLDPGRQTCVIQQIVVDGMLLAVITYEFEGMYDSDKPSASVLQVRRIPTSAKPPAQPRYPSPQYLPGTSPPTSAGYPSPLRHSPTRPFCQGPYPGLASRQRSGTAASMVSPISQRF